MKSFMRFWVLFRCKKSTKYSQTFFNQESRQWLLLQMQVVQTIAVNVQNNLERNKAQNLLKNILIMFKTIFQSKFSPVVIVAAAASHSS